MMGSEVKTYQLDEVVSNLEENKTFSIKKEVTYSSVDENGYKGWPYIEILIRDQFQVIRLGDTKLPLVNVPLTDQQIIDFLLESENLLNRDKKEQEYYQLETRLKELLKEYRKDYGNN